MDGALVPHENQTDNTDRQNRQTPQSDNTDEHRNQTDDNDSTDGQLGQMFPVL